MIFTNIRLQFFVLKQEPGSHFLKKQCIIYILLIF